MRVDAPEAAEGRRRTHRRASSAVALSVLGCFNGGNKFRSTRNSLAREARPNGRAQRAPLYVTHTHKVTHYM